MSLSGAPVNDDLLHALLSFAALSQRAPIVGFLADLAATLDPDDRTATTELLVRLFRVVHVPRPSRGFGSYQPRVLPVPARHAAYGVNLVLLTVCVAGSIRASQLYGPGGDPISAWKNEAMLWRSQLRGDQWPSIVGTLRLRRLWDGQRRDLQLGLAGEPDEPIIDPFWTYDVSPDEQRPSAFSYSEQSPDDVYRLAHFMCRVTEDTVHHALQPLLATLGPATNTMIGWRSGGAVSAARALLVAWLLPLYRPTPEEQRDVYGLCAEIATADFPHWDGTIHERYATLLLDRLSTDPTVPMELVADILSKLDTAFSGSLAINLAPRIVRCALAFLGRDPASDERIATVVRRLIGSVPPALAQEAQQALDR
jgi:hypothetical protein